MRFILISPTCPRSLTGFLFFSIVFTLLWATQDQLLARTFPAVTLDLEKFLLEHPIARTYDVQTRTFLASGLAALSPEALKNEEKDALAKLEETTGQKRELTRTFFPEPGSDIFARADLWKKITTLGQQEKAQQKHLGAVRSLLSEGANRNQNAFSKSISQIHDDLMKAFSDRSLLVLNLLPTSRFPGSFFSGPNPFSLFLITGDRVFLKEYLSGIQKVRVIFPSSRLPIVFPDTAVLPLPVDPIITGNQKP